MGTLINNELFARIISSIVLIPTVFFIIIKGSLLFNFFLILCFLLSLNEWIKISPNLSFKFFGFFFLIISFFTIYSLRNDNPENYDFFLIIILICILTDVGGYAFGKLFKGPKLTKISPKKTISGMLGSYISSFILVYIGITFSFFNFFELNNKVTVYSLTFLISTISQMGDILISYFKRRNNIKDTGKIIPGHGGLLDRIDGMIFVFPFCYIINLTSLLKL